MFASWQAPQGNPLYTSYVAPACQLSEVRGPLSSTVLVSKVCNAQLRGDRALPQDASRVWMDCLSLFQASTHNFFFLTCLRLCHNKISLSPHPPFIVGAGRWWRDQTMATLRSPHSWAHFPVLFRPLRTMCTDDGPKSLKAGAQLNFFNSAPSSKWW